VAFLFILKKYTRGVHVCATYALTGQNWHGG